MAEGDLTARLPGKLRLTNVNICRASHIRKRRYLSFATRSLLDRRDELSSLKLQVSHFQRISLLLITGVLYCVYKVPIAPPSPWEGQHPNNVLP